MAKPETQAQREKGAARREGLLDEAARELNRHGISQTSLTDIAQRLGVTRAALYNYVEDQPDLVFQCYRRTCEVMARRLEDAERTNEGAFARLGSFVDRMLATGEPQMAAISELAYLRDDQRGVLLERLHSVIAQICRIIEDGVHAGEVRACAAPIVAQAIVGLVSWPPLAQRWNPDLEGTQAGAAIAIRGLLEQGISTPRVQPLSYQKLPMPTLGQATGEANAFAAGAVVAAKREALLATGSWLFNLKGVDATSVEEVALRVGVSKMVVYHNIGDKQTFVLECYRRAFRIYFAISEGMQAHGGDRVEALAAAVYALVDAHLRDDVTPLAPLVGFDALPPEAAAEMNAASRRLMDEYLQAMQAGHAEGSVREVDAPQMLAVLPALFDWLPKLHGSAGAERRDAIGRELALLWSVGLRA